MRASVESLVCAEIVMVTDATMASAILFMVDAPSMASVTGVRGGRIQTPRRLEPAQQRTPALVQRGLLERVELDVGDRHQQQREEQAERLAADDRHGNRGAAGAAD